jgi:hypothetical protein
MKSKKTLVLAGLILALTLSAFPHDAAAGATTAPPQASSDITRKGGDSKVKYMETVVVLAADILLSAVLP